jgi:HK97 family phage prohead protease
MEVQRKDAAITTAPSDGDGPGAFEAILSAPTKDRDGDTLLPDEWKMPLPDKITVDIDHDMSVRGTIGSAKPWIDEKGNLRISGTFARTPLAQEVRMLMADGHIDKTSVAFMSEPSTTKDGKTVKVRELLNAAVVAIPSNREAAILEVRGLKAGARNSSIDAAHVQAIHDHALALGADPKGAPKADPKPAPPKKSFMTKDADTDAGSDPIALIQATDAAIDGAIDLLATVDPATLPPAVQQAIALIQAADAAIDELMSVAGIPDPDEDANVPAVTDVTPTAAKAATAVIEAKAAADADSDAVLSKALSLKLAQFI